MSRYFLGLQYKVHMLRHVELWLSRSLKVEKEPYIRKKTLTFELDDPEQTMVSSIYRTLRDCMVEKGGENKRDYPATCTAGINAFSKSLLHTLLRI